MIEKENNDINEMLDKLDKKQVRRLMMPRSQYKLQRMLTKEFCVNCRRLAYENTRRPYSDYCPDCQKVATKVLGGILK